MEQWWCDPSPEINHPSAKEERQMERTEMEISQLKEGSQQGKRSKAGERMRNKVKGKGRSERGMGWLD